jgi:hypothetical protein
MGCNWAAIIALVTAVAANGGEPPARDASSRDRLAEIQRRHKESEGAYYKAAGALPDTPEGNKKAEELWKEYDKKQAELFMAAVDVAKADPKSEIGFAALEWVLTIPRSYYLAAGKPALELVNKHHVANPKVGKIIAWVGYYRPGQGEAAPAATALIKAVAEKNSDRTARGQAVMALAWEAKGKFAQAGYRQSEDTDKLASEAENAFELIVKDYADCPRLNREHGRSLGDLAKQELFELRNLRVGKEAPDIEGEDLDQKKFKLSDYRGKVVVLDFWGDW